jgi:hypothetical protein
MSYISNIWVKRGGMYSNDVYASAFCFTGGWGDTNSNSGFRPVLLVGSGL